MYLHKTAHFIQKAFPSFLWQKPTSEKVLYLTFDDGPIPSETEFVLDTLKLFSAKATFFCVGDNVRKHPSIFGRILHEGHQVGNHTYNHLNGWSTCPQTYLENVGTCTTIMQNTANLLGLDLKVRLFRPPYGRLSRPQSQAIRQQYDIVMWDVLTGDFDQDLSPVVCYEKAVKNTEYGSIIIFHDSLKASRTMRFVLPLYLDYFANLGYRFAALPSHNTHHI